MLRFPTIRLLCSPSWKLMRPAEILYAALLHHVLEPSTLSVYRSRFEALPWIGSAICRAHGKTFKQRHREWAYIHARLCRRLLWAGLRLVTKRQTDTGPPCAVKILGARSTSHWASGGVTAAATTAAVINHIKDTHCPSVHWPRRLCDAWTVDRFPARRRSAAIFGPMNWSGSPW